MQRNNLFYLYQFVLLGGAAIGNLLDHNFRQLNKEERGRGEAEGRGGPYITKNS